MKVQQLLAHHGIRENPFGQEDAQDDLVFRQHCVTGVHHPAWDKIFGSVRDPSTAVVFGEKGSGKTALRLQIVEQIEQFNRGTDNDRVFVIEYDDLNPFLDCFRERLWGLSRRPERSLKSWRLLDHMDAILSLGVTRLVDSILNAGRTPGTTPVDVSRLDKLQDRDVNHLAATSHSPSSSRHDSRLLKRDLLFLATFYDHTQATPKTQRWSRLRRALRFHTWMAGVDFVLALLATVVLLGVLISQSSLNQFLTWWPWAILAIAWAPWIQRQVMLWWSGWGASRQIKVIDLHPNVLRGLLSHFERKELSDQPFPTRDRSDDRYALLSKFQSILRALGYTRILVLVDRVDEPQLVNGNVDRMRDLLWPLFDNKFLNHQGLGFKLMLPIEVSFFLQKEDREFFERSRLDKHNLIRTLQWTGESLYDVANDRLRACRVDAATATTLRSLFDPGINDAEIIATLDRLRVPRHTFKFLFRLLVDHCNRYTDDKPVWTINRETLQSTLALYQRDMQELDRGHGMG